MARLPPMEINSPKGFWPNPNEEFFHIRQTPPWKVPRKRKSRGRLFRLYYDIGKETLDQDKGEEVFTQNRFKPLNYLTTRLNDHEDCKIFEDNKLKTSRKEIRSPEPSPIYYIHVNDSFSEYNSFVDFMYIANNKYMNVSSNSIMYNKNKKLCSGYFPDFIIPDDYSYFQFSNENKHNPYYFYKKDDKYLKYLAKANSKYDIQYFKNMNFAYKVGKNILGNW